MLLFSRLFVSQLYILKHKKQISKCNYNEIVKMCSSASFVKKLPYIDMKWMVCAKINVDEVELCDCSIFICKYMYVL
jgi:hypothetical protein